ncbi:hypothetical protein [Paenibacillus xerothermodurans]|uniref:Uncharacterized protein n=1 Tax=Paenibacillus xerothermodurans TaxID=1977292 RepID=A0A2W1N911_PAEXE|nr:hypothetical protein [Paenibacillus xerothermodurans]PZE20887.1 hypothetical protein CBW46_009310 [Paenibacillus xerothermodurans]
MILPNDKKIQELAIVYAAQLSWEADAVLALFHGQDAESNGEQFAYQYRSVLPKQIIFKERVREHPGVDYQVKIYRY